MATTQNKMPYVQLGNSGLKVSKIILGCISYGSKDSMNMLYSNGLSEVILGNAIKKLNLPREELVIMTKLFSPIAPEYGMYIIDKDPTDYGIIKQQGLNRKVIDLTPTPPIEETMHALHVVKAGYVRYIGMSSCYAYQFHAMQSRGRLTRPISEQTLRGQIYYFLDKAYKSPSNIVIINRVEEIAKKRGISMAQVSLAWSMSKDVITAPVVGTTNLNNLKDIIESVHVKLTEEKIKYLEEPYHPQAIIGH
ncbi:NADP-dependent oxidoreductase domain-containing protein [Abortiporus biennis]|nr:NADP-dependent oxidoreductase domain-containing protein [Abortiporus biennis]